jgi:hypothetical protein
MKTVLPLLLLLAAFTSQAQNCVVDASAAPDAGIYPPAPGYIDATTRVIFMPSGNEGIFYDQTAQVKVPNDTVVDTLGFQLTATIDSMRMHAMVNLPPGLSYVCNTGNCSWIGGANGCVKISGTPTQQGVFNIQVRAVGFATMPILGAVVDTFSFDMRIEIGQDISVVDFSGNTLKIFPNPAADFLTISAELTENQSLFFEVTNLAGMVVLREDLKGQQGLQNFNISVAGIPQGYYLYRVTNGKSAATGQLTIAR